MALLRRGTDLLRALVTVARRGRAAAPVDPRRRRLVVLQVDGLSSERLLRALDDGSMPHLAELIGSGAAELRPLRAATPTSTPVFTAGLLYGDRGGVPGFGWYDRALGRVVRMDLVDDVSALESVIARRAPGPPLAARGVTYGTIWAGGAEEAFFNVVRWLYGAARPATLVRNAWDRASSFAAGAAIAGRVLARFALELGVGAWDFQRWCRHVGTTRFEWRFLVMRLFVSVVMRDLSTQGAVLDILRGVPFVFIDFLGYDEYAHRRGPDAQMALYNLRGIDHSIGRILGAARAVPEYGYDVWILSDHGQLATTPFERVLGRDLAGWVLEQALRDRPLGVGALETRLVRDMSALKTCRLWTRSLWRPLRLPVRLYAAWLERRLDRLLDGRDRAPVDDIEVVTGGSIAHLYFRRGGTFEELRARWPRLVEALLECRAVGLLVARGAEGPLVGWRGHLYRLEADRAELETLPPFRAVGYPLLSQHIRRAAESTRSGDIVLYGAFAPAGQIAYDFEFGSHGGIAPEELDQFLLVPRGVDCPLAGEVAAEEFYRFFHARYGDQAAPRVEHVDHHAA